MANYDLTYEGSRVQGILDTGNSLKDAGYIFRGEATPSTVPGTPTERVAYIGGPGTYTNFGSSITVGAGCICVFKYTGSAWSNQVINTGLDSAVNTLQSAITAINNNIGNGYVYAGVATPSTSPVTGKVFYLAVQAGTYTNFGNAVVTAGLNVIKYNGSAWSVDQLIAIDAEPTQGSANLVKSGGVLGSIIQNGPAFDLSAYNAQGGVLATYADLSAALTALNALPADFKKGGMSMKFVLSSDNKYVQYRLMANDWSIDVNDWQGVDEEPVIGSKNLVESGGVADKLKTLVPLSPSSVSEEGKYINNSGEETNTQYSASKVYYFNVDDTKEYHFHCYFSGAYLHVLSFFDNNNVYLGYKIATSSSGPSEYEGDFIPINGAVKVAINTYNSVGELSEYVISSISEVDSKIKGINDRVVDIEACNVLGMYDALKDNFYIAKDSSVSGLMDDNGDIITTFAGYYIDYYSIQDNSISYYFYTKVSGVGFSAVHYLDENNNLLGSQYIVSTSQTEYSGLLNIPSNTAKIAINRYLDDKETKLYYKNVYDGNIPTVLSYLDKKITKHIKCLFIGNSLNQDNVGYLPWLLKNTYPEIDFEIYNAYVGGYTIKQYVENVLPGNKSVEIFSVAKNSQSWKNYTAIGYSTIFSTFGPFDIISYQGFGNVAGEDVSYFPIFVDDLFTRQITPFKLGYLLPQNYYGTVAWERLINGVKAAVLTTPVDIVFAPGIVTELVKSDFGQEFITSDNLHNNQGLPCIMGGYEIMGHLTDYLGLPSKILNNQLRITQEIENELDVPGPSGILQIGTDAQYITAQKAAVQAKKYIDAKINVDILELI